MKLPRWLDLSTLIDPMLPAAGMSAVWHAGFAQSCYRQSIERGRQLLVTTLLLDVLALVSYDLPLYLAGHYSDHRMYGDLLLWRLVTMTLFLIYLPLTLRYRDDPRPAVQRGLAWAAIALGLGTGLWHAVLSQTLAIDISIYALSLFIVASLLVMPTRLKLLCYLVGLAVIQASLYAITRDALVAQAVSINAICLTLCAIIADQVATRAAVIDFLQMHTLGEARSRADALLHNIMPVSIATRLKSGEQRVVEYHDEVSVLFADVSGFTRLTSELPPQQLIEMLENLFRRFDTLADLHGVEKIKTVGDAYMAAAGVPHAVADHAERVARLALAMVEACARLGDEHGLALQLRVGIHSGSAISGVIAQKKFAYDLWGDTVNTASRLESRGVIGRIQVTDETRKRLAHAFEFEQRGSLYLKGKGRMAGYFLIGEKAAVAA